MDDARTVYADECRALAMAGAKTGTVGFRSFFCRLFQTYMRPYGENETARVWKRANEGNAAAVDVDASEREAADVRPNTRERARLWNLSRP